MSFSFNLKSHIYENGREQLLKEHLYGVEKIAIEYHRKHRIDDSKIEQVIKTICLCHDLGKSSEFFQQYLKDEYNGELKNHSEISAYFCYYMLPEEWKILGFLCVKRHHGNLEPERDLFIDSESGTKYENLIKIAESIEKNVEELNEIYNKDISDFFSRIKNIDFYREVIRNFRKFKKDSDISTYVYLHYIWSLLLTADKTQLIRGNTPSENYGINSENILKYKNDIRENLVKKFPDIESTELFSLREKIYITVNDSIKKIDLEKEHLMSINVPTGTGKTLAVYSAATALSDRIIKEKNIMPSIIYSLPFTSIIDQNYDVLEKILEKDNQEITNDKILKHHSMAEIRYKCDEDNEYKNYDALFCIENWQSYFCVTTFAQIFDTIFKAGINSIVHRFHKLAGSIIILDEVQAIDPKYYKVIEKIFKILCEKFNTYVIVVTATKPLFLEGKELVDHNEKIFKDLHRIEFHNNIGDRVSIVEFNKIVLQDILKQDKSFLIVLNTVKSALDTYNYLKENSDKKIYYLSTLIYPKRRIQIIEEIKKSKDKVILVSTQLIEAGVDLDFDVIYRDLAPLSSINQTAGRGNRNSIKEKGIVNLFNVIDERQKEIAFYVYSQTLLEKTKAIFKDRKTIDESEIYEINNTYFKSVSKIVSEDTSNDIIDAINSSDYQTIREKFNLIENSEKVDIIVNINEESNDCINKIKLKETNWEEKLDLWRILNQYKISVFKNKSKDILEIDNINGISIINSMGYDVDRGIKQIESIIF